MKKILLILSALICILTFAGGIYAEEDEAYIGNADYAVSDTKINYEDSALNKLGRGVTNTATCWAEIPAAVCKVSKEKDPFLGATVGVVQGTVTTLVRGATGIIDALTCLIPPYDKPMMQPEYALKNADDKFKEYLW